MSENFYLNRLSALAETHVIKAITGMHGTGKSTLLNKLAQILNERGIADENILLVDFNSLRYDMTLDYQQMQDYVKSNLDAGKNLYLFLDSLPDAASFDKIVGSLYLNRRLNIFITAANRQIIDELATILPSGAINETQILPPVEAAFVNRAALPYANLLEGNDFDYMAGLLARVFLSEIIERRQLRDAALLREIFCQLLLNLNEPLSAPKIAAILSRKTSVHTVIDYINALSDAYVVHCVPRHDTDSDTIVRSTVKYFVTDPVGFTEFYLGEQKAATLTAAVCANILWAKLSAAADFVRLGRANGKNIDFVQKKGDGFAYYQFAATPEERPKKLRILGSIRDQYPKTLITAYEQPPENFKGIKILSAKDFFRDTP